MNKLPIAAIVVCFSLPGWAGGLTDGPPDRLLKPSFAFEGAGPRPFKPIPVSMPQAEAPNQDRSEKDPLTLLLEARGVTIAPGTPPYMKLAAAFSAAADDISIEQMGPIREGRLLKSGEDGIARTVYLSVNAVSEVINGGPAFANSKRIRVSIVQEGFPSSVQNQVSKPEVKGNTVRFELRNANIEGVDYRISYAVRRLDRFWIARIAWTDAKDGFTSWDYAYFFKN